jgi:Uma2 family endonuclease
MPSVTEKRATLEDLYKAEGKAELINGRIEHLMASGDLPTDVAANIFVSLHGHSRKAGKGVAKTDGTGYAVKELPSGRESFAPDASYYDGPRPLDRMRFIEGAPNLAVEVRSEFDYGQAAEERLAEKRADYFVAGTQVVWDVDPLAECVHVYRATDPNNPRTYRRGETAEAEPAVPGWSIAVDDIFRT